MAKEQSTTRVVAGWKFGCI